MGKKISEQTIKEIIAKYQELGNQAEVARQLNISPSTVRRYLSLYEILPPIKNKQIEPELKEEINRLYSSYRNAAKVARELNISSETVRANLSRENQELKNNENNDRDALFFYIYKLFGRYSETEPINPWNIVQMQKFKSQGMPYRGQLLTLKYFYEVKGNTIEKSKGSIGIIPHIFEESRLYYEKQAKRAEEITKAIQNQLEQDRVQIMINPGDYFSKNRKKKKPIDLTTIGE